MADVSRANRAERTNHRAGISHRVLQTFGFVDIGLANTNARIGLVTVQGFPEPVDVADLAQVESLVNALNL